MSVRLVTMALLALVAIITGILMLALSLSPHPLMYFSSALVQPASAPEIGALAPDFTLPIHNQNQSFRLVAERGQSLVLNFWATWCAPCRAELPELEALDAGFSQVRVVTINVGDTPETIQAWLQETPNTLTILEDQFSSVAHAYHLRGQPTTFIIDPQGVITHIFYGSTRRATLEQVLATHTLARQ